MKFRESSVSRWVIRLALVMVVPAWVLLASLGSAGPAPASGGEATFKAKCAMCHGADGSGDTTMGKKMKIKDLRSAEVQKQSDADLAGIIAKGKSPMQGYEKQLDKAKIDELVAYLRELAKKK